ncbi:hypothetical protein KFE25_006742 [Diacronema lutheri]|uniref:Uncharacterized protein n=1 Tax=Diacronema lutheri TaxID=2081491 RepID=A0A8J6CF67_DIALT|nr:hypothetical protein KFE25_006742 [Diacronema lutheri]
MAEPFTVGLRMGAPADVGAAVRQRAEEASRAAAPTDPAQLLAALGIEDALGSALIAYALAVGPGPWLAPLGIGTNFRPTRQVVLLLARATGASDAQWARDAADGFAYELPAPMLALMAAVFLLAGLVIERFLLLALDDSVTFVFSLSGSLAIAAAFFELIRPPLTTRAAHEQNELEYGEFEQFASAQLERAPGTSCHETDIVRAYRTFYPKYRAASGRLSDSDIESLMRRWGRFERSPAGYYKGISLKPSALSSVF